MFKKAAFGILLVLAASSVASAQSPKVAITGLFGFTLSDGVSGAAVKAGDGNIYDRVDPRDSMNFGVSVGFFLSPSFELGFLWRRQATSLEVSGTTTTDFADANIDGYHGYGTFYFGDADSKMRLYMTGGAGMTNYSGISFTKSNGQTTNISSNARFSSTWGGGIKIFPSPRTGVQLGFQWTPTYIKSDATGWWCDPWFGCYVTGDSQYSNQFEFIGGIALRF